MNDNQYSTLWDKLDPRANPWRNPELYGQPCVMRQQWRARVNQILKAIKEVEGV